MKRLVQMASVTALAISALTLDTSEATERGVRFKQPSAIGTGKIAGTWKLVSIYQEDDSGEEIDQFGGRPTGRLMADRHGNFSFQVMSNNGRRLLANSPPAVIMARHDGLIEAEIYFGSYTFNAPRQKLTLHVAGCLFQGCDRTDRKADLRVQGDVLELRSAAEPSLTGAFYSHTVWKRECCAE